MFDLGHPTIQCDRRLAGSFWRSHISIQPPPAHSLRTLSECSLDALLSLLSSLSCILFPQKCNTDPDEYNYHMMVWYLFSAMMHGTAAIQHKGMGRVHVAPKRERESLQSRDPGMGDWEMDADWEEGLTLLHTLLYWPGRAYILQHSLLCRYLTFAAFQGRRPSRERASIRFVFYPYCATHLLHIYLQ
jgi:hypothetical protein